LFIQIFDCDFPRDVVRYVHNGNPHLPADRVRLSVLQFTDSAEVVSNDVIMIVHVSPPVNAIFAGVAQPRSLVVDMRRSPLSDVITPDVIQFRYNFSGGSVCTLRFSADGGRFQRQWLMSGSLVTSEGAPVGNLTMDCRDFLMAGFRYRYTSGRPRTAVDYIPLTASIENWTASALTETVFVPVQLLGGAPNSPPTLVRRSGSGYRSSALVADQFVPMLLSRENLTAQDDVTQSDDLLLSVLSPLPDFDVPSRGYFVHRRAPWKPIVAFWQRDLQQGSVAFRSPTVGISALGTRVDVILIATDGYFVSSERLRLPITVRPTKPSGPKVIQNRGLTVVRGGSACLGAGCLRIADTGGLDRVDVRVLRGGPLHGNLTLGVHSTADSFRWNSIQRCDVVYHHHPDSADNSDEFFLRISNGRRSVRTRIAIQILPGTASPPRLKLNDPTEVRQYGYAQLTILHLDTSKRGFSHSSSDVEYTITSSPRHGQVLMMYRPMTRGRPVTSFTQLDLDKGHIWYHHLGRSSPLRDSFRFLLRIKTSPTTGMTADGERIHEIIVRPHAKDFPPRLVTRSAAALTVRETDVQPIRRETFRYRDVEHPDEDVVLVVTCQPFVVGSTLTLDAGVVAYHDEAAFRDKNSSIVPLRTFTQSMIDGGMVAYVPPMNDIGPHPLNVQFIYSVSDLHGNFEVDQTFDVTVLPVNNQVRLFEQSSDVI